MGFEKPGQTDWKIPVSDTQAYRQFGNAVVVPVVNAVAQLMQTRIAEAMELDGREVPNAIQAMLPLAETQPPARLARRTADIPQEEGELLVAELERMIAAD